MDQRLKGQDTTFYMSQDGQVLAQLNSIKDFEITVKLKLLEEGYVGETTNRYDEVFEGFDGRFKAHETTGAVYTVVQAIIDRARRRVPGTIFSAKTTLQFPNGERKRVVIDNIFFGPIPNTIPARDEFVAMDFTFASGSGRFI